MRARSYLGRDDFGKCTALRHPTWGRGRGIEDPGRSTRGFTVIEIIAVLVMLGIVSAIAVSKFSSTAVYTLESSAEVIKSRLRYAQTRAMQSSSVWGVYFPSSTTYSLFKKGNTGNLVNFSGETANVVTLSRGMTVTDSAGTGIFSFDSWGKPCTDAAATSAAGTRSLTVSFGGSTQVITITQNTGFIQ